MRRIMISAALLAAIRERGKMIAVTTGNLPPNTFVAENNELTGLDIEVGRYIERKIGVPIEVRRLDWKGILPGQQAGRFDAVFSKVKMAPDRLGMFPFPWSRAAVVVVRRTDATDRRL